MHCTQGQMTNNELTSGTYWNIHVSEVTSKKESLPLGTVLQKLFHLLEKIMSCNNDTHCISKGKTGHIRAWNSRVIQL